MNRTVRALSALSLTLTLGALGGAGIAGAQEMEHGRTRPAGRELVSNQIKSQDASSAGYIANVRG